jgi:hypothetical protein
VANPGQCQSPRSQILPRTKPLVSSLLPQSTADCSLRDTAQTAYPACLLGVGEQSFAPLAPFFSAALSILEKACMRHSTLRAESCQTVMFQSPHRRSNTRRRPDSCTRPLSVLCHATLVSPHKNQELWAISGCVLYVWMYKFVSCTCLYIPCIMDNEQP